MTSKYATKNLLDLNIRAVGRLGPCPRVDPDPVVLTCRPTSLARLLLVVVLAAAIFGAGHLIGVATSRSWWPCCSRSSSRCRWVSGFSPRCGGAPRPASRRSTSAGAGTARAAGPAARGKAPPADDGRLGTGGVRGRIRRRRPVSQHAHLRAAAAISCSTGCRTAWAKWQAGTMEASSFDEPGGAGRTRGLRRPDRCARRRGGDGAARVSAVLGLVAAAIPDGSRVATLPGRIHQHDLSRSPPRPVVKCDRHRARPPTNWSRPPADYDVVTTSLVQSANGAVLDADALRASVAGTDTLTVIDVTQAVGWKRVDLPWVDVTAQRSTSGCWRRKNVTIYSNAILLSGIQATVNYTNLTLREVQKKYFFTLDEVYPTNMAIIYSNNAVANFEKLNCDSSRVKTIPS